MEGGREGWTTRSNLERVAAVGGTCGLNTGVREGVSYVIAYEHGRHTACARVHLLLKHCSMKPTSHSERRVSYFRALYYYRIHYSKTHQPELSGMLVVATEREWRV